MQKKHSVLLAQLDFINAPDTKLETLFLVGNERLIKRSIYNKNYLHPPTALCRTAQQIRQFYEAGLSQKREMIEIGTSITSPAPLG